MELIDFSNCEVDQTRIYRGANGKKLGIKYNNEIYMLKFPALGKAKDISYSNSAISEYISCHIFESCGFKTQQTILGIFRKGEEQQIACACKDFTVDDNELIDFAPIFDCGSCLYPQLTDELMKEYLQNEDELDKRVYVFPNSALKTDDKKINYYDFITNLKNEECNKALKNIYSKINLNKIDKIIDETPGISNTRKQFYKLILKMRYNLILTETIKKIKE